MDTIKILKRAWSILMDYRILWIFGILLALTVGGSGMYNFPHDGSRSNIQPNQNIFQGPPPTPLEIKGFPETLGDWFPGWEFIQQNTNLIIGIAIALVCLIIILLIVFALIRYVSESAVIRLVDKYEETGEKLNFRQGWRLGWSRSAWRMFLINFIVNLPGILMAFLVLVFGIIEYLIYTNSTPSNAITGMVIGIGILFLLGFSAFILQIPLNVLRHFFWRTCAIEGMGVFASIRLGFIMVKRNLKDVVLMWLIMIGLGIAYAIAFIPLILLMIPIFLLTAIAGLIAGGLPGLLVAGIASLFLQSPWQWIIGGVLAVLIFIPVVSLPLLLVKGFKEIFRSIVWTLVYRELRIQKYSNTD